MQLYQKPASELAVLLRTRQVSAVEILEDTLRRIETAEPAAAALLCRDERGARQQAADTDRRLAAGDALPMLAGIPYVAKDNLCTRELPTTCASRMLQNHQPLYDATVIIRMRQAGALLIGKAGMDEFGMGFSDGGAAAVAACEVPLSLGLDTGGSVRYPASLCGVVGLKPTYGTVSRFGLVPFAPSLDQVGTLARTVQDTALLFSVICGPDVSGDATSLPYTCDASASPAALKGLRVGVPAEYFEGCDEETRRAIRAALTLLEQEGAQVREISLPSTPHVPAVYAAISSAEACSGLAKYDGVRYGFSAGGEGGLQHLYRATRSRGFGDEVKRRILLGIQLLSGENRKYLQRAGSWRRVIAQELETAFEKVDVLITPVCLAAPSRRPAETRLPQEAQGVERCTAAANLAGLPAVSIPCGTNDRGYPIGMQLVGPKFAEKQLLAVAAAYEALVGGFPVKEGGL